MDWNQIGSFIETTLASNYGWILVTVAWTVVGAATLNAAWMTWKFFKRPVNMVITTLAFLTRMLGWTYAGARRVVRGKALSELGQSVVDSLKDVLEVGYAGVETATTSISLGPNKTPTVLVGNTKVTADLTSRDLKVISKRVARLIEQRVNKEKLRDRKTQAQRQAYLAQIARGQISEPGCNDDGLKDECSPSNTDFRKTQQDLNDQVRKLEESLAKVAAKNNTTPTNTAMDLPARCGELLKKLRAVQDANGKDGGIGRDQRNGNPATMTAS